LLQGHDFYANTENNSAIASRTAQPSKPHAAPTEKMHATGRRKNMITPRPQNDDRATVQTPFSQDLGKSPASQGSARSRTSYALSDTVRAGTMVLDQHKLSLLQVENIGLRHEVQHLHQVSLPLLSFNFCIYFPSL
jgi:hypothetical protein